VREGIFSRRAVTAGRLRPHHIREIIRITSFKIREIIRITSRAPHAMPTRDAGDGEAFVRAAHAPSFTRLVEKAFARIAPTVHVCKCQLAFSARTIGVTMRTFLEHATA